MRFTVLGFYKVNEKIISLRLKMIPITEPVNQMQEYITKLKNSSDQDAKALGGILETAMKSLPMIEPMQFAPIIELPISIDAFNELQLKIDDQVECVWQKVLGADKSASLG